MTPTTAHVLRLVIAREVRERLRSKAFLVVTVLLTVGVALGSTLPGLLSSDQALRVGTVGGPAGELGRTLVQVAGAGGTTVRLRELPTAQAAREAVGDATVEAALTDADTVLVRASLADVLDTALTVARRQVALQQALTAAGVPADRQAGLLAVPPVQVLRLQPDDRLDYTPKVAVGLAAAALLYGLLIFYGQFVAQGMVQEKQSRVIEVLLSVVRPLPLLLGKVLGLGLLGLAQVLLLSIVAAVGLTVSGTFDVLSQGLGVLGITLGWYLLGFALYATLFALAGSIVSRVEDLQATVTPVVVLLVGSLLLVQLSLGKPGSAAAVVAAVLPFSAPLAQPVRQAAGAGAGWEAPVAVALTVMLLAVLVPVTARVYAGAALVTRGRASYRQALRRDRST